MPIVPMGDAGGETTNKYGAQRVLVDGVLFASKREARRWAELKLLERADQVCHLRRQVSFPLTASGPKGPAVIVGCYVADFVYDRRGAAHEPRWVQVVEDAKGLRTALYRWKKRHFEAQTGLTILET